MIHWIFMIRLSWSCTWSWTPCPRPPPWTSTSSSPPWPSTSTSAWTWTPPLFYPRSQSLAILLNFYLLDLLQNSFLCVARMTASWAEHTHILHSPFLDTLHLHLDLSIILSLDLFLDPFLDLNNGFSFNIGFFSTFGGDIWGRHAKWERSRGSDRYQKTWILPELYNNRM